MIHQGYSTKGLGKTLKILEFDKNWEFLQRYNSNLCPFRRRIIPLGVWAYHRNVDGTRPTLPPIELRPDIHPSCLLSLAGMAGLCNESVCMHINVCMSVYLENWALCSPHALFSRLRKQTVKNEQKFLIFSKMFTLLFVFIESKILSTACICRRTHIVATVESWLETRTKKGNLLMKRSKKTKNPKKIGLQESTRGNLDRTHST